MLCSVSSEFDKLDLGDKRLTARAAMLASSISENPETSINAACGSFSANKTAYRFFENERIYSEQLLQQHVSNTCERITSTGSPILVIQDTADLIYTRYPSTEGLGSICQNSGFKDSVKGIQLHTSLAVTSSGVPLGILKQTFFTYEDVKEARGQTEQNDRYINKKFSIDKKVSYRWRDHCRSTCEMISNLEVIHVAEREGDIYEFLQMLTEIPTKFVIRSSFNRRTHEGPRHQDCETIDQKLSIAPRIGQITVKNDNEEFIFPLSEVSACRECRHQCCKNDISPGKTGHCFESESWIRILHVYVEELQWVENFRMKKLAPVIGGIQPYRLFQIQTIECSVSHRFWWQF